MCDSNSILLHVNQKLQTYVNIDTYYGTNQRSCQNNYYRRRVNVH